MYLDFVIIFYLPVGLTYYYLEGYYCNSIFLNCNTNNCSKCYSELQFEKFELILSLDLIPWCPLVGLHGVNTMSLKS